MAQLNYEELWKRRKQGLIKMWLEAQDWLSVSDKNTANEARLYADCQLLMQVIQSMDNDDGQDDLTFAIEHPEEFKN